MGLMNALGKSAVDILGMFGVPDTIQIGKLVIDTSGIFSAVIVVATFFVFADILKKYLQWILLGIAILFGLNVLSNVIS